ncbi:MAG: acetyl-CoA carboxylase, biotin carboxyl carrier protein [Nitrospirae bacterium RBG_19FT_COMBO_42_15]|nr:MAG: acetyl-CoA carboxylase, biotin carboxyl carrier protein [Nitrospirae bacterium RBG_19FT_COMBO_42_15]
MNIKELKELIDLMKNADISELEIEKGGVKVKLKKGHSFIAPAVSAAEIPMPQAIDKEAAAAKAERSVFPSTEEEKGLVTVASPIVGTFYRAPAPDAKPYVEVGDIVKKGQVLCLVEAMKLMNEIESELNGKISAILVDNGHPVEYGEALFKVEPVEDL